MGNHLSDVRQTIYRVGGPIAPPTPWDERLTPEEDAADKARFEESQRKWKRDRPGIDNWTPWNDESLKNALGGAEETMTEFIEDTVGEDSIIGELTGEAGKKRAREGATSIEEMGDLRRAELEIVAQEQANRLRPFVQMGQGALGNLQTGDFGPTSKRFQFELDRGSEQIEGQRAAKGVLRSSGTVSRLRQLGGRLATEELERKRSRQEEIAGLGVTAIEQGGFVSNEVMNTSAGGAITSPGHLRRTLSKLGSKLADKYNQRYGNAGFNKPSVRGTVQNSNLRTSVAPKKKKPLSLTERYRLRYGSGGINKRIG